MKKRSIPLNYIPVNYRENYKPFRCAICSEVITGQFGNNPDPVADVELQCCDWCDGTVVLPARLARWGGAQ